MLNLTADLRSEFSWNTKQLFVYVVSAPCFLADVTTSAGRRIGLAANRQLACAGLLLLRRPKQQSLSLPCISERGVRNTKECAQQHGDVERNHRGQGEHWPLLHLAAAHPRCNFMLVAITPQPSAFHTNFRTLDPAERGGAAAAHAAAAVPICHHRPGLQPEGPGVQCHGENAGQLAT